MNISQNIVNIQHRELQSRYAILVFQVYDWHFDKARFLQYSNITPWPQAKLEIYYVVFMKQPLHLPKYAKLSKYRHHTLKGMLGGTHQNVHMHKVHKK